MNMFSELSINLTKELSKEIKGDFILIMDGAGWHKSKNLIIPKNIQIILLPLLILFSGGMITQIK